MKMNVKGAQEHILRRLERELSPKRTYHSLHHTLDVHECAIAIAGKEGIEGHDLTLLRTAALFHDAGFIVQARQHEEISCMLVREILPAYRYEAADIERICSMIMATKVPQSPNNHLERILCDADLDYLGRDDFSKIATHLYDEFLQDGIVKGISDWDELQVRFISQHRYFTETCRNEREPLKVQHLEEIRARVAKQGGIVDE